MPLDNDRPQLGSALRLSVEIAVAMDLDLVHILHLIEVLRFANVHVEQFQGAEDRATRSWCSSLSKAFILSGRGQQGGQSINIPNDDDDER